MPDIPEEREDGGTARIEDDQTLFTGADMETKVVSKPMNVKQRFKAMLETERKNNELSQLRDDAHLA